MSSQAYSDSVKLAAGHCHNPVPQNLLIREILWKLLGHLQVAFCFWFTIGQCKKNSSENVLDLRKNERTDKT